MRPSRNPVTVPEVPGTVTGFRLALHGFASSAVGSLNLHSRRRAFVPHARLLAYPTSEPRVIRSRISEPPRRTVKATVSPGR
jgi:hypothetical protein